MAETILCPITGECNCTCNCRAYFSNNRSITAESLTIDENEYAFSYLITDPGPALKNIVFCIRCPLSEFEAAGNTEVSVIGNPNGTPVAYTLCTTTPCPANSYTVNFDFNEERACCVNQGIKIGVASGAGITEIRFILTFTLPTDVTLSFQPGVLPIQNDGEYGIVNYFCMPGCSACDDKKNICELWASEKDIIVSKKNAFVHSARLLFPDDLDLSTLTLDEIEMRLRQLVKLAKSTANINCKVARVLDELNKKKNYDSCCLP